VVLLGVVAYTHGAGNIMSGPRDIAGTNWNYGTGATGESNWQTLFQTGGTTANTKWPGCGGAGVNPRQSPINIATNTLATPATDPGKIKLNDYDVKLPAALFNTGRHLTFKFGTGATHLASPYPPQIGPVISGGPLPAGKAYVFDHAEFHWGNADTTGSEHQVNSVARPLEIQLIHYDSVFQNLQQATSAAITQQDSVAIISFLGVLNTTTNANLEKIIATLPGPAASNVLPSNRPFGMNNVCLGDLLPLNQTNKLELDDYYYYSGSLTRPGSRSTADTASPAGTGCEDNALWIVATDPIGISAAQLTRLRTLQDETNTPITATSRSLQALAGRTVTHRQRAAPNAVLKGSNPVSQIAATFASSLLSVGTFAAVMNFLQNNDDAAAALRENPIMDLMDEVNAAVLGNPDENQARQQEVYNDYGPPEEHHIHQLHHAPRY